MGTMPELRILDAAAQTPCIVELERFYLGIGKSEGVAPGLDFLFVSANNLIPC